MHDSQLCLASTHSALVTVRHTGDSSGTAAPATRAELCAWLYDKEIGLLLHPCAADARVPCITWCHMRPTMHPALPYSMCAQGPAAARAGAGHCAWHGQCAHPTHSAVCRQQAQAAGSQHHAAGDWSQCCTAADHALSAACQGPAAEWDHACTPGRQAQPTGVAPWDAGLQVGDRAVHVRVPVRGARCGLVWACMRVCTQLHACLNSGWRQCISFSTI